MVLVGHGSKARGFDGAMKRVAASVRRGKWRSVECAYLEITRPSIPAAIARAVKKGAKEVRIMPYFVLSGRHIREHIPQIVSAERKRWAGRCRLVLCPYLGYDRRLAAVVRERLRGR